MGPGCWLVLAIIRRERGWLKLLQKNILILYQCLYIYIFKKKKKKDEKEKIMQTDTTNTSISIVLKFQVVTIVQTQKDSNERLFILTRTQYEIFGEISFVKPQNDT